MQSTFQKKKNSNQSMKSAYSKLYVIKNIFKPLKIILTITVLMALVVVVKCRNTQLAKINSKKCNLRNDTKTKHFFYMELSQRGQGGLDRSGDQISKNVDYLTFEVNYYKSSMALFFTFLSTVKHVEQKMQIS